MFSIPVLDANDSLSEIVLDDRTFFLHISWNSEAEQWTLTIENVYNEIVVAGIAIVSNYPLLQRFRYLDVPVGELIAVVDNNQPKIGRNAFVTGGAALIYVPAEEL